LRGCFVTGTDTSAGKTVLTAAITAVLRARGVDAVACKPVITGLDEPGDPSWPPDHLLLARVSACTPELVSAIDFGPAVSPHLAAEMAERPLHPAELRNAISAAAAGRDAVIVEGVGGLLVPFADGYDVRSLAGDLGLPVIIAARPGLGTINHTLLTLEAARLACLHVPAVVLTPWPPDPDRLQLSNRQTIARLGQIEVFTLPTVARPEPELLVRAAEGLPLAQWVR
jgi:dethiobiotin synthetase